eukprot:4878140-Alexandrium_andersonii.AAC.1
MGAYGGPRGLAGAPSLAIDRALQEMPRPQRHPDQVDVPTVGTTLLADRSLPLACRALDGPCQAGERAL